MPPYLARWTGFVLGWVSAKGLAFYRRALLPLGIDENHLGVLLALEHLGPQVQRRLSQHLAIDVATMVRVVNGLEEKGLAERQPHPTDGRAYQVRITSTGRETVRKAEETSDRGTEEFFGVLLPEERQTFRNMLLCLAQSAPESPAAPETDVPPE